MRRLDRRASVATGARVPGARRHAVSLLCLALVVGVMTTFATPLSRAQAATTQFTGTATASTTTAWRQHTMALAADTSLTLTLDWADPTANLNLFLQNSAKQEIARSAATSKPEVIRYVITTAGTYIFGIRAAAGSSSYTLTVDTAPYTGGPPPTAPTYAGDYGRYAPAEVSPVDQVTDAAGNWYLMDEGEQCIKVYSPTGVRLPERTLFTCTAGEKAASEIQRSRGIGFDRNAQELWIADTTNHRVLRVGLDGAVLASSTGAGASGGTFLEPGDVTVDSAGNAYVIDDKNRVVVLSSTGAVIRQFGATGTGVGQMRAPLSIEYSSVGAPTLYITDAQNGRIVKWGTDGSWKGTLGGPGTGPGRFSKQPRGIAVDSAGTVFAADTGGNRINRFSSAGAVLAPFGTGLPYYRTGPTDLFYGGRGLWVHGDVLGVADMWNARLLLWDRITGASIDQIAGRLSPLGGHTVPQGVALDAAGNVYVSDYWNQHIQKIAADGTPLASWGIGRGSAPGTLNLPGGIDVDDSAGFVYIANREERAVDRWRLSTGAFDKRYLMPVASAGAGWPRDVAVNEATGLVWAPDEKGKQVVAFNATTGEVVRIVTTHGSSPVAMGVPQSVALDESGNLYVADASKRQIHVYNATGTWLRDLVTSVTPRGIDVQAGVVYLISFKAFALSATTGAVLYSWGDTGTDAKLTSPYVGIEVGPDGAVYIADSGSGRVKVYRH